jgi:hypothetical protein
MVEAAPAPGDQPMMVRDCLLRQFDLGWRLAAHHLGGLDMATCLWRPAPHGLHVTPVAGGWAGEWPVTESYSLGPSSLAWLIWHWGYWLSMAIDHNFGPGECDRHRVIMPGDSDAMQAWLKDLAQSWRSRVAALPEAKWQATTHSRWPFQGRPFADILAWSNMELMKSAAEIGYVRFLHSAGRLTRSCG